MSAKGPRTWIHSQSAELTVVFCQIGGESDARDPQAGRTGGGSLEAVVRGREKTSPSGLGAERPPQRRRRQCDLAQRPGRVETTQHADTAAPDTPNNAKHSGVSSVVIHAVCIYKTAQHELHIQDTTTRTPTCARCSCFSRAFLLPAFHCVSLCEVARGRTVASEAPSTESPRAARCEVRCLFVVAISFVPFMCSQVNGEHAGAGGSDDSDSSFATNVLASLWPWPRVTTTQPQGDTRWPGPGEWSEEKKTKSHT